MVVTAVAAFYQDVKSTKPKPTTIVSFDRLGFYRDRRWMVVHARTGKFISQRTHPQLALVSTHVWAGVMRFYCPGIYCLELPEKGIEGESSPVTIHKDKCIAVDQGDEAASWFSAILGVRCRLVHTGPNFHRLIDPNGKYPKAQVGFADRYHGLIVSTGDIGLLQRVAQEYFGDSYGVELERTRPNLVVDAPAGWLARVERLKIGPYKFALYPCIRCQMVNNNPRTGQFDGRFLKLLQETGTSKKEPTFGRNLLCINPTVGGYFLIPSPVKVLRYTSKTD